jgi:hypothetical protein
MAMSDYTAAFSKWLRSYLMQEAYRQQGDRMAKTPDETMLPAEIVNNLYAAGLWPPPVPPMPLTSKEWYAIYPKYINWHNYTPPRIDPDMQSVAQSVYQQLMSEFQADAQAYQAAIGPVLMPDDIRQLTETNDMLPPYGSAANPVPAPSGRKGVL